MKERAQKDGVGIEIAAPSETVYALVSDITQMGKWSPECRECRWIDGATGPTPGARFKAVNRAEKGPSWSNKPQVVVADPGREFAFSRKGPGIGEVIWRYRMTASSTGTRLEESYEVVKPPAKAVMWLTEKLTGITDRTADLNASMSETLKRIRLAAEAEVVEH
jgi:hypothetical protein